VLGIDVASVSGKKRISLPRKRGDLRGRLIAYLVSYLQYAFPGIRLFLCAESSAS
jgi:hypothetical protein